MTITEILAQIQELTNTQNTTTSSYTTVSKTRDINSALNKVQLIRIQNEGKWQVDDTNQTDYPIITGSMVANQQDYSFTTDADGNQILDIYRVEIKDSTGTVNLQLQPIDQSELTGVALTEFMKTSGTPQYYDKTSNGVFLYPAPSYNSTNGIKFYVNRSPYYFTAGDVATGTKKAGIPWSYHEYLAIRPSYFYCLQKGLPQTTALGNEMLRFEEMIAEDTAKRAKDEPQRIKTVYRSSR
jgi:hypothetical protein